MKVLSFGFFAMCVMMYILFSKVNQLDNRKVKRDTMWVMSVPALATTEVRSKPPVRKVKRRGASKPSGKVELPEIKPSLQDLVHEGYGWIMLDSIQRQHRVEDSVRKQSFKYKCPQCRMQ